MRRILTTSALVALVALAPGGDTMARDAAAAAPIAGALPAGTYRLDKPHTSLIFRVSHLGFSFFTGRFTGVDAALELDPADPAAARLVVEVDPSSLAIDNPPDGFIEQLLGAPWLDAAAFPALTYRSIAIELTGPDTARITGDLTLHGVTRPVMLEARFNGGYAGHPMDPNARIGFSAEGALERSQFGIAEGLPPPGTTLGIGDQVEIVIEAELIGPPLAAQ